jgi:hypothetical protein
MLKKFLASLFALFLVALVATPGPVQAAGVCAQLFGDNGFSGDMYTVVDGADINDIGDRWDDKVSSLTVQPGCTLRLWEDTGKRGDHRSYKARRQAREVSWIGQAWNDCVSSLTCSCR